MNRATRSGGSRLTAPPTNANIYAGKLSWSPWLHLWPSSEGRIGETRATEIVVNIIGALLEFHLDDAGVASPAQLGAVEKHAGDAF